MIRLASFVRALHLSVMRLSVLKLSVLILSGSWLFAVTPASAEPVEFGLFAPRLYFQTPEARDSYAQQTAAALSEVLDVPVHGRAFSKASDLVRFIQSKRLDLVLLDVAIMAETSMDLTVIGHGSGPEGRTPNYAVLGRAEGGGVNQLEGKAIVLPTVGVQELKVLSNFAFEGEVRVDSFFGRLHWSSDLPDIAQRTETGRATATIAYQSLARPLRLSVVAELRGMPLPVLVSVGTRVDAALKAKLDAALADRGIALPQAGPLTHLMPPRGEPEAAIRRALSLAAGQRPVRRAIWSPPPVERLDTTPIEVRARGRYPLQTPAGRWRVPEFPDIR